MTVIRWNPLREFDDLFHRAGQANRAGHWPAAGRASSAQRVDDKRFTPLADISETDAAYFIDLELPGIAAQDVNVSVHDGVLSISGERTSPHVSEQEVVEQKVVADDADVDVKDEPDQRRVFRAERNYGSFERRFRLPKDASLDAVEASAKEGVLTVSIARRVEDAARAIEVKVA